MYMQIYRIFIILAIVCALCAGKIDKAVKTNKKVKKIVLILCGVLFLISIISIYKATFGAKEIGTISGPEYDYITIDGVTYVSEASSFIDIPYNRSDKGRHPGIIKSGEHVFHIYEVKGDPERKYLYWTWEWEGEIYIREDLLDKKN